MSRAWIRSWIRFLLVGLFLRGFWQVAEGSWIYAKAKLAQCMLQRAWSRTLAGDSAVKPWPWADMYPVAKLTVPSMALELIVLNGASGRTLAFGPGYVEASAFPGSTGTTVLTGHRDTHFRFLKRLRQGDEVVIHTVHGTSEPYLVQGGEIVDARTASIRLTEGTDHLLLVTCYPFDSVVAGGPLRYVITALRVPAALPRSIDTPAGRESEAPQGSAPRR
jgi:sortase A